jgi:ribosomal protection tetracycline resistance protein
MSEVERSLLATDAVILLISAADGVQAQTRVLWHILETLKIPRFIVVNKIDRAGVDIENVIKNIEKELSTSVIITQTVSNIGSEDIQIDIINKTEESIVEKLAEYDDNLLEAYFNGDNIDYSTLENVYENSVQQAKLFPVLFSIAKSGLGINEILNEIVNTFSPKDLQNEDDFSAIVFKISHNQQLGLLTHLRIFSGSISKKQEVYNQRITDIEKVNQIKTVFSNKLIDIESAYAGQIVAVSGFSNARVGDVLGKLELEKELQFSTIPILTVEVKAEKDDDYANLAAALNQLNIEDPLLDFRWFKDERELHIKINGWIQMQILETIIENRFSIKTQFQTPAIVYKETPSKVAYGYEEYTMPKPCWAVMKLKIEPLEQGSGVQYSSDVGVNDVLLKYQKEVERTIPKALEQGIKGWEVTDLKITFVEGEDHVMHSRAGDFVIATPMALMNGLTESGTTLLEPIMKFTLEAPEEILGQIASDIHNMRGEFEQPVFFDDRIKMQGLLPAATSMEYAVKLASRSGGKAFIQMQFHSYQKVEDELGKIRDYVGINPLDRAKYILKARKAIQ